MIRHFWLICFFTFLICLVKTTSAKSSDSYIFKAREFSKEKKKYEYLLYLPKEYNEARKYPLIIYLHGSSQKGSDLNKLKAYGPPQLVEKGRHFDFIIASPQCPANVRNWSAQNWFDSLYLDLVSKYKIDTDRVYLTGISMGGGGTFEVAKENPDKFAALVPLCAWDSEVTDICKISNIPIWTFHGRQDSVVPLSETEEKVKMLKACKGNIQFTVLENEGHTIQWLYEKQDTYNIYEWMLKHKRKAK